MSEPVFISRFQLEVAHRISLQRYGGRSGVRSDDLVDSALNASINDFLYTDTDLFGMAAAYAFHIAQAQVFLDGNKRTAIEAAFVFLEANGVSIKSADSFPLHEDLLAVAERRMTKAELALRFRELFDSTEKA